jgi:hypothetical protein
VVLRPDAGGLVLGHASCLTRAMSSAAWVVETDCS